MDTNNTNSETGKTLIDIRAAYLRYNEALRLHKVALASWKDLKEPKDPIIINNTEEWNNYAKQVSDYQSQYTELEQQATKYRLDGDSLLLELLAMLPAHRFWFNISGDNDTLYIGKYIEEWGSRPSRLIVSTEVPTSLINKY